MGVDICTVAPLIKIDQIMAAKYYALFLDFGVEANRYVILIAKLALGVQTEFKSTLFSPGPIGI